jgi:dihydroorotase/N-acyl-D-amino-acid deacylase
MVSKPTGKRWANISLVCKRSGMSVNVASYVGATQIRSCVLGDESRAPTSGETEEMKQLAVEAMQGWSDGLSSSLIVPPDTYLDTRQLTDLASAVKPFGGIYSTHMRSEGQAIFEAIREAISIGEQAQVPVDIIHLKIADKRLWGRMPEVIKLIEEAQAKGLHVYSKPVSLCRRTKQPGCLDSSLGMEGGREQMLARLGDPALRSRMEKDILNGVPGWFDHYLAMKGWESCVVAGVQSEKNKVHEGKSIEQISKTLNKKPTDVVFDLLKEEGGSVPAVYFLMSEEDVRTALQDTLGVDRLGWHSGSARWDSWEGQAAPTLVWHVSARAGKVCPGRKGAGPRGSGEEDDVVECCQTGY